MIKRILSIARKETLQLSRDTRLLLVIFLFPVFLLLIFGYAVNFNVKHIKIAVYDSDKSSESREFVQRLSSGEYFDIVQNINSSKEIKWSLDKKLSQCVLVIPNNFSAKIHSREETKIQILVDGVDGNTAKIIMNYMNAAVLGFAQEKNSELFSLLGFKLNTPLKVESRFWFNPELDSTLFQLPGLIAMILIVVSVISISLSVVREKERGTLEQINVSQLSTIELLLGKTVPYIIISFVNAGLILFAGYLLFGITVKGSWFLLIAVSGLFLYASLSMGILISIISDSQQVAFQLSSMISLLPSTLLSGFIFPIESMPAFIQPLSNITPAKFYIICLRDILIKGQGISNYWDQMLYLTIFGTVMLIIASVQFKKKTLT